MAMTVAAIASPKSIAPITAKNRKMTARPPQIATSSEMTARSRLPWSSSRRVKARRSRGSPAGAPCWSRTGGSNPMLKSLPRYDSSGGSYACVPDVSSVVHSAPTGTRRTPARHVAASAPRRLRRAEPAAADGPPRPDLSEIGEENHAIVERAFPYTMTGVLRLDATVRAVRYCVARDVPGAFVECGVWRGGSVLAMLLTLQELGVDDREVYLFDTFEGMTEPTEHDTTDYEKPAIETWEESKARGERPWAGVFGADVFDENSVRESVLQSGYPAERVHLVKGPVEETVPGAAPERIALLRLDTDWYGSTRHELIHLYPRLIDAGVLIIDDYGHWQGARRAVDEYFGTEAPPLLLNRIDY